MSNTDTTVEQKVDTVELLDCGAATEVTKGALFSLNYEGGWAPFDRVLEL